MNPTQPPTPPELPENHELLTPEFLRQHGAVPGMLYRYKDHTDHTDDWLDWPMKSNPVPHELHYDDFDFCAPSPTWLPIDAETPRDGTVGTPRTDDILVTKCRGKFGGIQDIPALIDFARTLETELSTLTRRLAEVEEEREEAMQVLSASLRLFSKKVRELTK